MPTVKSVDIVPGSRLGVDLLDSSGRLLIPAGAELTPRHCRGLAIWGIKEVVIEGDDVESPDEEGGISSESLEKGRLDASRLYIHCDLAYPPTAELFELTAVRLGNGRMKNPEGLPDAS